MNPGNVFQLELASAVANKRGLSMKIGFALLLGTPFVFIAMPRNAKIAGLMMILLFISFFGAAVGYVRKRQDGHLAHLRMLPIPHWAIFIDIVLAGAAVDAVQLGPLVALFVLLNGVKIHISLILAVAAIFAVTVLSFNTIGTLLGSTLKKNSEVHLIGALCVAFLAVVSDLFPVPGSMRGVIAGISTFSPLSYLAGLLTVSADGGSYRGAVTIPIVIFILLLGAYLWRSIGWKREFMNSDRG